MKLLYYTKYSRLAASSRLRSFQYFPFLKEKGCQVTVSSLFNDQYLNEIYSGNKIDKINIVMQYVKRVFSLFFVFKYDIVLIEKELFPYFPAFFERLLNIAGVKYAVDYDDAIFHNYDESSNTLIRFFLKYKIDVVMRLSSLTIVGSEYIQERARSAGANNILFLPTVIDKSKSKKRGTVASDTLVIGWIGSPTTLKYLESLKSVFLNLALKYKFKLHIVGGKKSIGVPELEEIINWSEETEVDEIMRFDIGIMPLKDSKWEKGKCAYKLIQCMACGVSVVGSNVGANKSLIKDSLNGFLAESEQEWYEKLETLLINKSLRITLGENGYQTVMERYTIQAVFDEYFSSLQAIIHD